jgi:acetyl-CoA acetyltransferase
MLGLGIYEMNSLLRRTEQDAFAASSHKKAAAATQAGRFKDEIVALNTYVMDPKTKEKRAVTVAADDGIRANTSVEGLGKLKPSFKEGGSTTAGNSSQVLPAGCGMGEECVAGRGIFRLGSLALDDVLLGCCMTGEL